ncbi:MAG: GNAT family N-acetyltransferase, partial [Anaerolineae bacterium]
LRTIGQRPDHAVFVAEAEGVVVGWVHVYAVATLESPAHAEIGGLVVDEAHRGRGIGRALMERAEAWARGMGLHTVRLRSNVIRAEAHAFYERIGYAPVKTQKVFAKRLA